MNDQLHLDTGARALHALPHDEAADFDAHLSECDTCAQELSGFHETLALLGAAAAEDPPAGLHEKVMRDIAVAAQLSPGGSAGDTGPKHARKDDDDAPAGSAASESGPARHSGADESGQPAVTSLRRWYRRPATLLLAAAVAAVLIAGGVVGGILATRGDTDPLVAMEHCVHDAPDSEVIQPKVGSGGQVTMAPSCDAAIVDIGPLPATPAGKGYQLWVMAGSQARSVGMVQEGNDRLQSTFVTPLHQGDTDIGISVEPAGGSKTPTTSPMWVVPLKA